MHRIPVFQIWQSRKLRLPEIIIILFCLAGLNIVLLRFDLNVTLSLLWIILLFINPLYSAPLIAGEYGAGTDPLLLTLPISDRDTVMYLFWKGFFPLVKLILILLAGLLPAALIVSVDPGQFALSLGGLLLGSSLLTSSGLFCSSFFKKTAPAWFFISLVQGVLFLSPPLLGSQISPFFLGYLSASHTLVLISLSGLSLLASFISIRLRREGSPHRAYPILVEIFLITILSFFVPGGVDTTLSGHYRVNRVTAQRIRALEDPLFVRWYHTDNLPLLFPQSRSLKYFMDSLRIKGMGKVNLSENRDVKNNDLLVLGKSRGWQEQTVQRGDNYEPLYSALEIEYRGRRETLPLVYDPVVMEEQFLAALQRLTGSEIPEIGIITGRNDRPMDQFWTIFSESLGEYFSLRDYTGKEELLKENKPQGLFVLNGRDLDSRASSLIMEYAREGGAVLAALSPLELNPQISDRIEFKERSPLMNELNQIGISWGETYIVDYRGALYLSSGDNSAPDLYPLWFRTSNSSLFDYDALWTVPLYYSKETLWKISSSHESGTAGNLTDISPASLSRTYSGIRTAYDTAMALKLEKGILVVVSGAESFSDLMVLSPNQGSNGAWIQSLAFFLSNNQELMTLRKQTLGVQ